MIKSVRPLLVGRSVGGPVADDWSVGTSKRAGSFSSMPLSEHLLFHSSLIN